MVGSAALKRRLEILLCRLDKSPLDVSKLERQKQAAEKAARREKAAITADKPFTSAFKSLSETIPKQSNETVRNRK
jgi:hypothetical protein